MAVAVDVASEGDDDIAFVSSALFLEHLTIATDAFGVLQFEFFSKSKRSDVVVLLVVVVLVLMVECSEKFVATNFGGSTVWGVLEITPSILEFWRHFC